MHLVSSLRRQNSRAHTRVYPKTWLYGAGAVQILLAIGYLTLHHNENEPSLFESLNSQIHRKDVHAVVSDTGSWNTIQPVLLSALKGGCGAAGVIRPKTHQDCVREGAQVHVHMTGACARKYREGSLSVKELRLNITFEVDNELVFSKVSEFVKQRHSYTLVGASSSKEGTRGVVAAVCSSSAGVVVLVEDRYATALSSLDQMEEACPQVASKVTLCVADHIAADIVKQHSNFRGQVQITGAPMFDGDVREQHASAVGNVLQERRSQIRNALGLGADDLVVLVAGQSSGIVEQVQLLLDAIQPIQSKLGYSIRVLVRHHPRALEGDTRTAEQLMKESKLDIFDVDLAALASFPSSDSLVAGADLVMSGYSTTNYYALLWQVPAVVYSSTPTLREKFRRDKHMEEVPEVGAGAAWSATTPSELQEVFMSIVAARTGKPSDRSRNMRAAQLKLLKFHDGNAARRVWTVVTTTTHTSK